MDTEKPEEILTQGGTWFSSHSLPVWLSLCTSPPSQEGWAKVEASARLHQLLLWVSLLVLSFNISLLPDPRQESESVLLIPHEVMAF